MFLVSKSHPLIHSIFKIVGDTVKMCLTGSLDGASVHSVGKVAVAVDVVSCG